MPKQKKHNNRQLTIKYGFITRTIFYRTYCSTTVRFRVLFIFLFRKFSLPGFLMTLQSASKSTSIVVEKYLLFIGLVQCLPFGPFFSFFSYFTATISRQLSSLLFVFYFIPVWIAFSIEPNAFHFSFVYEAIFCPLLNFVVKWLVRDFFLLFIYCSFCSINTTLSLINVLSDPMLHFHTFASNYGLAQLLSNG